MMSCPKYLNFEDAPSTWSTHLLSFEEMTPESMGKVPSGAFELFYT